MKQSVAIVGGGASAILLAAFLDSSKFNITIYEQSKSLGRKLLVAGKGGFNLSHSETMDSFIERYTPNNFLEEALLHFTNNDLRAWLTSISIPTFVGSSKRVFPEKGIKPIDVLNVLLEQLNTNNVQVKLEHQWTGWEQGVLCFNEGVRIKPDYTVFAFGGGSWKVTGSDGGWSELFKKEGIQVNPFLPANCAYAVNWESDFLKAHQGKPLKNIALSCEGKLQLGEVVITELGIEGNAIYALTPQVQSQLTEEKQAVVYLDLKPSISLVDLEAKMSSYTHIKMSNLLKNELNLSSTQIALLKAYTTKDEFLNPALLAAKMKQVPLIIVGASAIDEAISTTGGIALSEIDSNYQVKRMPHTYCIGEMLDWNAPTGGYLLQGCFSMGVHLAEKLNRS